MLRRWRRGSEVPGLCAEIERLARKVNAYEHALERIHELSSHVGTNTDVALSNVRHIAGEALWPSPPGYKRIINPAISVTRSVSTYQCAALIDFEGGENWTLIYCTLPLGHEGEHQNPWAPKRQP